jgi:hypothetical protein
MEIWKVILICVIILITSAVGCLIDFFDSRAEIKKSESYQQSLCVIIVQKGNREMELLLEKTRLKTELRVFHLFDLKLVAINKIPGFRLNKITGIWEEVR